MNYHGHALRHGQAFGLCCLLPVLLTMSHTSIATLDNSTDLCYAYAMIGKDSVINARLGMLPEELMELAELDTITTTVTPYYSIVLLQTILDAYLWQDSPYAYAQKIYLACDNRKLYVGEVSKILQ